MTGRRGTRRGGRGRRLVRGALAGGMILAGCHPVPRPKAIGPRPSPTAATTTTVSATSSSPPPTATPSCPARVLATLGEAQRVGQLFMVGVPMSMPNQQAVQAMVDAHAGGVVLYGNSRAGVAGTRALTDRLRAAAAAGAPGVGIYVATDQEGGEVQELAGPGFDPIPPAEEQGHLDPAALQRDAGVWAAQLAAAGVNVDLAPVLDVVPPSAAATNQPIARYHRQLGADPITVAVHGVAVVQGLQAAAVVATLKHFPGLGRVVGNTDNTAGVIDTVTTRHDPSLESFAAGVRAGAHFVMVSLATYRQIDPDHRAAFSGVVIHDLLRGDLGFRGLVLSDDLGAATEVADLAPGARALDFLQAGGDIVVAVKPPTVIEPMVTAVMAAEAASPAFRKLVDERALAVLAAKEAAGLLTCR